MIDRGVSENDVVCEHHLPETEERLVTEQDIRRSEFTTLFGCLEWYQAGEVDDFLDCCAESVRQLYIANSNQRSKLIHLERENRRLAHRLSKLERTRDGRKDGDSVRS